MAAVVGVLHHLLLCNIPINDPLVPLYIKKPSIQEV